MSSIAHAELGRVQAITAPRQVAILLLVSVAALLLSFGLPAVLDRFTYPSAPRATPPTGSLEVAPDQLSALKLVEVHAVDFSAGAAKRAVGVPESAVIYEGQLTRVWVLRSNGLLELRDIATGRNRNGIVDVSSGLAAGDRVVTSDALSIDRGSI